MSANGEELSSQVGKALGEESEEKSQLLEKIKRLESENRQLREDAKVNVFKTLLDEMEGAMSYGIQVLQVKDEEIRRMGERMLENNTKWKGYVKLLVDQIGRKNALIESMREEMDRFFEKTKKQEAANRENQSKLTSYEELIQIDQQLLKQSKQIEVELNGRIRKLDQDNKRYSAAIKTISETAKKKIADYSGKVDQQQSIIRHLASIVNNFRGRFMYNNIGRQSGILSQIGRMSVGGGGDCSEREVMNPLEYEFTVIWSGCQEKLVRRRCDLLERSLSVGDEQKESAPNYLDDLVQNQSISVSDAFCAYSDYVSRVLSLYELFCKSNILLQYFQFKALRYLRIGELPSLLKKGEVTGIVQWVCNITSEIGFLSLNLGSLIMSIRSSSGVASTSHTESPAKDANQVSFSTSQVSQLPSMTELKPILKWINNISHALLNDNLSQNVTYEEVKQFNRLLHAKIMHVGVPPFCPHENVDINKNAGIELLPVCCVDAMMNINMSLSILVRINVGFVRESDLGEIYAKSLELSERFYSKCGSLSLNGIHYPIDDRLFCWNGLYWSRVLGESVCGGGGFKASFEEMILKQRTIYEAIHDPGEGQDKCISECVGQLLRSVLELETNLDGLLNPVHMDFGAEGFGNVNVGMDSLPEVVIAGKLQKLILGLDDQMELEIEEGGEEGGGGVVSVFGPSRERREVSVVAAASVEAEGPSDPKTAGGGVAAGGFDSPKKAKYENSIRLLNEKILSLRKELAEKEVLYSSFETMQGEYRKLQDHKQLLMRRLEEQELEMRISQDRMRKYEDTVRQMKVDSDGLRRDLESLQNIPKIKAYSELDVLEPVYLRRLIRLMSNKLYELEMNRWNEKIAREDPNRLLRSDHSQRMILGQSRSRNSLDKIAARLLEREERRQRQGQDPFIKESVEKGGFLREYLEEDGTREMKYSDLLGLIQEFNDLQKQIMLHRCSIPIMSKETVSGSSFEKEWEKYTLTDSKLKYKLHIMKTSLQGLLYGSELDSGQEQEQQQQQSQNKGCLGDTYINRKIGRMSLRIPAVGSDSVLGMIHGQSGGSGLKVSIGEWNEIIQSLVKITT